MVLLKMKWILPILVIVQAQETDLDDQSALSKYQQKRQERKQARESERNKKREERKKERLNRLKEVKETNNENSLSTGVNQDYKNDQRFVNTEFIASFKSHHDTDDILYTTNYVIYMAKHGADVSDIPVETDNTGNDATARAAGIPGIINLWDKYIDPVSGRYQIPYAFEPKFDEWGRKVVRETMDLIESEMPCIMFIDANPRLHRDYLYFMQSRGCHRQGSQAIRNLE